MATHPKRFDSCHSGSASDRQQRHGLFVYVKPKYVGMKKRPNYCLGGTDTCTSSSLTPSGSVQNIISATGFSGGPMRVRVATNASPPSCLIRLATASILFTRSEI